MKLFGNRNAITDDQPNQHEAIARIEITKKGTVRKVKALLVRCIDSATIYKSEYETSKSDPYAYNVAIEALEKYVEYEGLEIISKSTNIDLPYVKTSSKKMR
jgi:hypothetical protein